MPWIGSIRKTATSIAPAARSSSASRSPNGHALEAGQERAEAGRVNSGLPLAESEPSVSPWKPWSARDDAGSASWLRKPSFGAASTASVPELVKRQRSRRRRRPARAAPRRAGRAACAVHMASHPGRVELERLASSASRDARVVAADVVHAEAAEHVEVTAAVVVEEVRAFGPHPGAVEVDRAQHADELRVDRARPEVEVAAVAAAEQGLQVEVAHDLQCIAVLSARGRWPARAEARCEPSRSFRP